MGVDRGVLGSEARHSALIRLRIGQTAQFEFGDVGGRFRPLRSDSIPPSCDVKDGHVAAI
jgi:hypothetical protein